MDYLLSSWRDTLERIGAADRILLLSDFDGTLSPIVGRPEEAVLPPGTRKELEALATRPKVGVAVVSGRALADIKNRVGIPGITYAGNHGIEIEGPYLRFVYPPAEAARPAIREVYIRLNEIMAGFEGAFVEDKGITLSVHYRLLRDDLVDGLKRACDEAVRVPRSEGKIRITEGKKVYEVRPGVLWDKEDAIVLLMSGWTPSGRGRSLAIFLGDDLTDEGGFKAVNAHGGISVFVGESDRSTAARYVLRSPEEVEEFLRRLTQAV